MLSFPLQLLVCASLVCGSWSRGGIEAQPPQRDITLFVPHTLHTVSYVWDAVTGCARFGTASGPGAIALGSSLLLAP